MRRCVLAWCFAIQLPFLIPVVIGWANNAAASEQPIREWTWRDGHSQTRTRAELREILRQHKLWLESNGKSGVRADLRGADFTSGLADNANLFGSELAGVELQRADLREINLCFADLSAVDLSSAELNQAKLAATWLPRADLSHADMRGAFLTLANLREANLTGTELKDADFYGADMTLAVFEPNSIPEVVGIAGAGNLHSMIYVFFPNSLTMLRKQFEATGLREQEREITYALRHTGAARLLDVNAPILLGKAEGPWPSLKTEGRLVWKGCAESSLNCVGYLFDRMFFDFTCRYGMP